jgi:hypothetical protein
MNADMYTDNSSNGYMNDNQLLSLNDTPISSASNQLQQNTNNNGKIIGNEFSNIKFT